MKTNTLTGADLNRAVAMALGHNVVIIDSVVDMIKRMATPRRVAVIGDPAKPGDFMFTRSIPDYAGDIAEAWPILERHSISLIRCDDDWGRDAQGFCNNERIPVWAATDGQHSAEVGYGAQGDCWGRAYLLYVPDVTYGATAIEAGLRRVVYKVLGAEVELT